MIKVKNVRKKFKKYKDSKRKQKIEFYAVDDISFEINDGEVVGVLGPNGAGKTTLLRMIAGIMEPTSGEIYFDNYNHKNNEIEIKKSLAYLSGNTKIYQIITGYELLKMCCEFYGVEEKKIEKKIEMVSKTLNMNSFLHTRIENLSTGQMQRVNIARCLVHDPKYYILDEATNGLDIMSSQIILDFIKSEKNKGKSILYSTHYMEEAENICDKIVMVNKGKVIKTGTPNQIKKETKTTNLRDAFFALVGGLNNEE